MSSQLIIQLIQEYLQQRPNCRILVLEVLDTDAEDLVMDMRACALPAGHSAQNQILVIGAKAYNVHKRRLGPVDIVIEHNRYNVRTVRSLGKSKDIAAFINNQPGRSPWPMIIWHRIDPDTSLLMQDYTRPQMAWMCGDAYVMPTNVSPMRMVVQPEYTQPCHYSDNLEDTWFCRSCGRFRGITYRSE